MASRQQHKATGCAADCVKKSSGTVRIRLAHINDVIVQKRPIHLFVLVVLELSRVVLVVCGVGYLLPEKISFLFLLIVHLKLITVRDRLEIKCTSRHKSSNVQRVAAQPQAVVNASNGEYAFFLGTHQNRFHLQMKMKGAFSTEFTEEIAE